MTQFRFSPATSSFSFDPYFTFCLFTPPCFTSLCSHPPHGIKRVSSKALTPSLSCRQSTLFISLHVIPYHTILVGTKSCRYINTCTSIDVNRVFSSLSCVCTVPPCLEIAPLLHSRLAYQFCPPNRTRRTPSPLVSIKSGTYGPGPYVPDFDATDYVAFTLAPTTEMRMFTTHPAAPQNAPHGRKCKCYGLKHSLLTQVLLAGREPNLNYTHVSESG